MKKKLLVLSLSLALVFGLDACGSGSNPAGSDNSSTPSAPAGKKETSGGRFNLAGSIIGTLIKIAKGEVLRDGKDVAILANA